MPNWGTVHINHLNVRVFVCVSVSLSLKTCASLHTGRQFQLAGRPLTDSSGEKEACSHTPPGANTPALPPVKSGAALSCTPRGR